MPSVSLFNSSQRCQILTVPHKKIYAGHLSTPCFFAKLQANTGQLVTNKVSKFTNKTLHNAKPCIPSIHIQELYLVSWNGMQCLMPLRMWEKNASASQPVLSASWVRSTAQKEHTKCEFTQLGVGKSPQPCTRYNHTPDKSKF